MRRRQKIRPGMVFRVTNWDERFEILRIDGSEVVAKYYRDFTVTVIPLWDLLQDLDDGELTRIYGEAERGRTRRQRRRDRAELRNLQKYARLLDREWVASRHGGAR